MRSFSFKADTSATKGSVQLRDNKCEEVTISSVMACLRHMTDFQLNSVQRDECPFRRVWCLRTEISLLQSQWLVGTHQAVALRSNWSRVVLCYRPHIPIHRQYLSIHRSIPTTQQPLATIVINTTGGIFDTALMKGSEEKTLAKKFITLVQF